MRGLLPAICLASAISPFASAQSRNHFPDTPENHWAYQALADLKSQGLLLGSPDGLGRQPMVRNFGRYEFAVCIHTAYTNIKDIVRDLQRTNENVARFAGRPEDEPREMTEMESSQESTVKSFQHILLQIEKDFLDLIKTFAPELKSLGVDPTQMETQAKQTCNTIATFRFAKLGEATKQFADVPKTHWAAEAVQTLRSVGILRGYPVDLFGG